MGKNIDAREEGMFNLLQEKLGKIYDKDTLKGLSDYVAFQKTIIQTFN